MMKPKLTKFLPQIRCTEETRVILDQMCQTNRRTLSNMLQIIYEDVAEEYKRTGKIYSFQETQHKDGGI